MFDISDDLLKRGAGGSEDAFKEIYQKSSTYVYTVAVRIVGNHEEAEEITQDVFLKVHKYLKNFRFESSFKTWIYRITVNIAFSHAKKRAKKIRRQGDFDSALLRQTIPPAATVHMETESNERLVQRMLNILNPEQRICIVLREIEGLRYEEIADVLNININTVRTRIKRARDMLMKTFKKRGEDDEL